MAMHRTKFLKGECSHCRGHIEFPAEAAGMSTECPHCGKSTELLLAAAPEEPTVPRRTIVWTMVAVLILCAGLGGVMLALRRTENWAARRKEHSAPTNSMAADSSGPKQANSQALNPWGETGFGVSPINLERT